MAAPAADKVSEATRNDLARVSSIVATTEERRQFTAAATAPGHGRQGGGGGDFASSCVTFFVIRAVGAVVGRFGTAPFAVLPCARGGAHPCARVLSVGTPGWWG